MSNKTTSEKAEWPTYEAFQALVTRANSGDDQALADLRAMLDLHPEIWQTTGDMAAHARLSLIQLIAKKDVLTREAVLRKAAQLELELAGPNPTPLEKLAVERIVLTWLENQFTHSVHPTAEGSTVPQGKFFIDLKESADRRLSGAIKSLCLIRKLLPAANEQKAAPETCSEPPTVLNLNARPSKGRQKTTNRAKKARSQCGARTTTGPVVPKNRVRAYMNDHNEEEVLAGKG